MPPVAFCKHPHLNKPVRPARLCGKKYDPERSGGVEIFFQQTRRARSCRADPAIRNLLAKKPVEIINEDSTRFIKSWNPQLTKRKKNGRRNGAHCFKRREAAECRNGMKRLHLLT